MKKAEKCFDQLSGARSTRKLVKIHLFGLFINYLAQFFSFFDRLYCFKFLPFQFLPSWIGDLAVVGTPSTWQPRKEVHRESVVRPACLAQHSGCAGFLRAKKGKKKVKMCPNQLFLWFNCRLGIIHKSCRGLVSH